MPMKIPAMTDEEPLETWLFRNRFELDRLYQGMRRTERGINHPRQPVAPARRICRVLPGGAVQSTVV